MTERIELTESHTPGQPSPIGQDFCDMVDAYREAYGADASIPLGIQARMWGLAFERHEPQNDQTYNQVV